jgi:hypothetical protein
MQKTPTPTFLSRPLMCSPISEIIREFEARKKYKLLEIEARKRMKENMCSEIDDETQFVLELELELELKLELKDSCQNPKQSKMEEVD